MGQVIKANFKTELYSSAEDDFDFEMSVAMEAIPNCKTPRDEAALQAHFESLLARAEDGMRQAGGR